MSWILLIERMYRSKAGILGNDRRGSRFNDFVLWWWVDIKFWVLGHSGIRLIYPEADRVYVHINFKKEEKRRSLGIIHAGPHR